MRCSLYLHVEELNLPYSTDSTPYPMHRNAWGIWEIRDKKSGNYSQALVYYQRAFDILPIPYFSNKLEDVKVLLSAETNEE
jgi:hypothetical protein